MNIIPMKNSKHTPLNSARNLKYIFISLMLFGLTACAVGGILDQDSYPVHHFSFDAMLESPDIEVLDYQYSNDRHQGVRPERERVNMGQTFCCENIAGSILRGDFLYVKWRVRTKTGDYLGPYEDKVDLRSRLPEDITGLRIHFIIRGPQLYVYLIWPYDPKSQYPVNKKSLFDRVKYIQIYPDVVN
jgi:hypothetical protein